MSLDSWLRFARKGKLFEVFAAFARYSEDAPPGQGHTYHVKIGSKILYSDCTADLLKKVEAYLKRMKKCQRPKKSN